jgi:hypothetical protein
MVAGLDALAERLRGGQLKGKSSIADNFDAPDEETEALFSDGPLFPEE